MWGYGAGGRGTWQACHHLRMWCASAPAPAAATGVLLGRTLPGGHCWGRARLAVVTPPPSQPRRQPTPPQQDTHHHQTPTTRNAPTDPFHSTPLRPRLPAPLLVVRTPGPALDGRADRATGQAAPASTGAASPTRPSSGSTPALGCCPWWVGGWVGAKVSAWRGCAAGSSLPQVHGIMLARAARQLPGRPTPPC